MKTYYYMGKNARNQSGTSWKGWKVERQGKVVQAWWGPAKLVKRKPVANWQQTKKWRFGSETAAQAAAELKIEEKKRDGYYRPLKKKK